jgi:hypothetical protein
LWIGQRGHDSCPRKGRGGNDTSLKVYGDFRDLEYRFPENHSSPTKI